jgi:hypothetical protein
MFMRQIILLSLLLIILSSFVYADCSTVPVCGITPADSTYGYGLVQICETCYACGIDNDGVCPEDFMEGDVRASCKKCPDMDCKVNVTGKVVFNDDPNKFVPAGLKIYMFHGATPKEGKNFVNTTTNGEFKGQLPSGDVYLMVVDNRFDSEYIFKTFVRGIDYQDIVIRITEGICNEDCTGALSNTCKKSCNGQNGCSFPIVDVPNVVSKTSAEAAKLCDGVLNGNERFLASDEDSIYNYVCCETGLKKIDKVSVGVGIGQGPEYQFIKDLRSTAIPVIYKGQIYHLVLNVWKTD